MIQNPFPSFFVSQRGSTPPEHAVITLPIEDVRGDLNASREWHYWLNAQLGRIEIRPVVPQPPSFLSSLSDCEGNLQVRLRWIHIEALRMSLGKW